MKQYLTGTPIEENGEAATLGQVRMNSERKPLSRSHFDFTNNGSGVRTPQTCGAGPGSGPPFPGQVCPPLLRLPDSQGDGA